MTPHRSELACAFFDFSALDDPTVKEDAVREELIAPLLQRLGYHLTGDVRAQRSTALTHPFVMIGSKKREVKIVPDYTLWFKDDPLMILDAKAPTESLLKSKHAEQAYSYAMHPEVRCGHYALCNGHELVVYQTDKLVPLATFKMRDMTIEQAVKFLGPRYLKKPMLRRFDPDLGVHLSKMGCPEGWTVDIKPIPIGMLSCQSRTLYSATAGMRVNGVDFCVTCDFAPELVDSILAPIPVSFREQVRTLLDRAPFHVFLDKYVKIEGTLRLGKLTPSQHEAFIPFTLESVTKAEFLDDEWVSMPENLPSHFFSLAHAMGHPSAKGQRPA